MEISMAQSFQRAAEIGADVAPIVDKGLITTMEHEGVSVWFFKDQSLAVCWDAGVREQHAIVMAYHPVAYPTE